MKLQINKILAQLFLAGLLFLSAQGLVQAKAPMVIVKVQDQFGKPVSGVNVKWKDVYNNYQYQPTSSSDYVVKDELNNDVTIHTGEALFRSIGYKPSEGGSQINDEAGNPIPYGPLFNHDLDGGTADDYLWMADQTKWPEGDPDVGMFGCGQNPHSFEVFMPPEMRPNLQCQILSGDAVELQNAPSTNTFVVQCQRQAPKCPENLQVSCDQQASTATISWTPSVGTTNYVLWANKKPYEPWNPTEDRTFSGNFVQQTMPIVLDSTYQITTRAYNDAGDSGACEFKEFVCSGTGGGCPGGNCCKSPTAQIAMTRCPGYDPNTEEPDVFRSDYSLSNINSNGNTFNYADLMIEVIYDNNTRAILDFLSGGNGTGNQDDSDYSLWDMENRTKKAGDWFRFTIYRFGQGSNNNAKLYRLELVDTMGERTVAEFIEFLKDNPQLSKSYHIVANVSNQCSSTGEEIINHNIRGTTKTLFEACGVCSGASCSCSGTSSCTPVQIIEPSESVVVPDGNKITVSWTPTGQADPDTEYELLVYNSDNYASPNAAFLAATDGATTGDYAYFPGLTVLTKDVFINNIPNLGQNPGIAVRGSCSRVNCPWTVIQPPIGFTITGSFFNSASNTCSGNPILNSELGNPTITVEDSNGTVITTDPPKYTTSGYSVDVPDSVGGYRVRLSFNNELYICGSCTPEFGSNLRFCRNPNLRTKAQPTAHFYVQLAPVVFDDSWWQIYGGQVFATDLIDSKLPITTTNTTWRLIEQLISGNAESAGVPITNRYRFGPENSEFENVASWLSNREPQLQAPSANVNLTLTPDYNYYKDKLGDATTSLPDEIRALADLNGQPKNGVIYHYREGDLKFAPNETWAVNTSDPDRKHHVVLVNGNITFSSERLTGNNTLVSTQKGSTTTFVAAGNIIIGGNVGNADFTANPNLSGIFIGNNIVVQDGTEKRFVGAGTFYGWTNVLLQREFDDDALNETIPSETFIYRPDFVINLPDVLRDTNVTWREVN